MLNHEEEITPKNVIDLVIKECKRVIANISKKHDIDYDELLDDNLPEKIRLHNLLIKRKNRRNLPMSEMCMGRKLDMQQCTRRRQEGSEYCASHSKKLKMGRIDEPFPSELLKGKRGRRKKQVVNVEQQDCISTYVEVINRQKFLIDDYSRVYYYNEINPQDTCYIGLLNLDGTIKFDENYLKYYYTKYKVNLNMDDVVNNNIVNNNEIEEDIISDIEEELVIDSDSDNEIIEPKPVMKVKPLMKKKTVFDILGDYVNENKPDKKEKPKASPKSKKAIFKLSPKVKKPIFRKKN